MTAPPTTGVKAGCNFILLDSGQRTITRGIDTTTNLTAIETTYNNTTTTAVSADVACSDYRQATVFVEISKANTPTDIMFEVEGSYDGTNFFKLMNGPLGSWIYDDVTVGSGISRALTFPIACEEIRVRVTCTGTDASNTFTVDDAAMFPSHDLCHRPLLNSAC